MMSGVAGGIGNQTIPGVKLPTASNGSSVAVGDWHECLESIIQSEFKDGTILEEDSCGLYKIEIINETDSMNEHPLIPPTSIYYIEMNATNRCVRNEISS